MPYIKKEQVKKIREDLKKEFPRKEGWKFSIINDNYSAIRVRIMESPIELRIVHTYMDETIDQKKFKSMEINHFHINNTYRNHPEIKDIFNRMLEIIDQFNGVEVEDADYGTIPNYYVTLSLGDWEKPFKVVK